jgi:hypothetical protein
MKLAYIIIVIIIIYMIAKPVSGGGNEVVDEKKSTVVDSKNSPVIDEKKVMEELKTNPYYTNIAKLCNVSGLDQKEVSSVMPHIMKRTLNISTFIWNAAKYRECKNDIDFYLSVQKEYKVKDYVPELVKFLKDVPDLNKCPANQITRGLRRARDIYDKLSKHKINIGRIKFTAGLDIGCGDGDTTTKIFRLFGIPLDKTYGIDVFEQKDMPFNYICSADPFAEIKDPIDLCLANMSLHHMEPAVKLPSTLQGISNKMVKGGYFIVREHLFFPKLVESFVDLEHALYTLHKKEFYNTSYVNDQITYKKQLQDWINIIKSYGFDYLDTIRELKFDANRRPSPPYDNPNILIFRKK